MNYILTAILLLSNLFHSQLTAQEVTVFESGNEGYASFRIPAIVEMGKGQLIAFAEGRVDHAGDFGNVDLVYKVSKDKGRTWGTLQIAVDHAHLQAGNPAPVMDRLDKRFPKGRLFLFYNTGNNHEGEVRKGNGWREVWYIASTDEGKTWSDPVNITTQVHRPLQPLHQTDFNFKEDWRTYANTPGHGFQWVSGPYKGRIYIAANHNSGDPKADNTDWNAHAYFSDDHGKTFHLSQPVPYPGTNESSAAQVGPTSVYMSSRNQTYTPKQRIVSRSNDGGSHWLSSVADPQLPDPINQGSVISWKKGKNFYLAHINASNVSERDNLTLRLSKDQGKTWSTEIVLAKAPEDYKGSYAAYSDMVYLGSNNMGIVYEKDNYKKIVFTKIAFEL